MANEQKQDGFKEVSDKLEKAMGGLAEARKVKDAAEQFVVSALAKRDSASAQVKSAEDAVGELHRTLKAVVEGALGVKHNG
jgi:uncharacterized coiled-coil DUF342 family protein